MDLEYITFGKAAKYMGVHVQAIYKAVYRKKLKYVKQKVFTEDGVYRWQMFTTKQWLKEWDDIKNDKDYMRQNGKLIFQPQNGKYSSSQAQEALGMTKNQFAHYRITGQIKYTKVGYYYLYDIEDIEKLRQKIEEKERMLKTG